MKKKQSSEGEVKKTTEEKKTSQADALEQEQQANADKKESLTNTLKEANEALAAANDKYLRLYSEFENFRRRNAKEKLDLIATAGEGILKNLLLIADDFERALEALQQGQGGPEAAQEGIKLIHNKLIHLLQQAGVKPMLVEKGVAFDTKLHEAVTQLPVEDRAMQGKVIDVIEKGYWLKEKVLRFAKVVIGA